MTGDLMRSWYYKMLEETKRKEAETKCASQLGVDGRFFDVQWSLFKDKPALPLKTLLPLSVGLNPSHPCAKIEWAHKYGDKAIGKAAELLDEILTRHGVLIEFIDAKRPEISLVDDGKTGLDRMAWPSVFVAFARTREWSLPKDFPALPDMPGSEAIKTPPASEQAKNEGKEGSAGTWQEQARKIADECFDRDTSNICRDSLAGHSSRVMDEIQKRRIHGRRGLITNPATGAFPGIWAVWQATTPMTEND